MDMMTELKRRSVRSAVTRLIVLLLASAVLVGIFAFAMGEGQIFKGATPLTELSPDDGDLTGRYVVLKADYILGPYAYDNNSEYYLAYTSGRQSAVAVRLSNWDVFFYGSRIAAQQAGYRDGSYTRDNPAPAITLRGGFTRMDSTDRQFFAQVLGQYGTASELGFPTILYANHLDGASFWFLLGMAAVLGILVLVAVKNLISALNGGGQKALRRYLDRFGSPEAALNRMNNWFPEATTIGKNVWLSPEVILFQSGPKTLVYELQEVIWSYKRTTRTNGIATSHTLVLNTRANKTRMVAMASKNVDEAMEYLLHNCSWIALGHNRDLARAYKKTPEALGEIARQQRMGLAPQQAAPGWAGGNYN